MRSHKNVICIMYKKLVVILDNQLLYVIEGFYSSVVY